VNEEEIRILLVEDETYVRDVACEILESEGYQVLTAKSAKEALHMFEDRGPIDLLLTDIVMPGMNGQDLARQLTSRHPALKTIYMSGYADVFGSPKGQELTRSFIQKPFTLESLTEKVKEVLAPVC
jgi:DNA-binding NtrC family response regulator